MLRNELERQKKALGQEVALLHKEKNTLHDRGKCRRVVAKLMVMVSKMNVLLLFCSCVFI